MTVDPPKSLRFTVLVCLTLVVACILIYGGVAQHRFLAYDDDLYITHNPLVVGGLTMSGVVRAFTTITESNWIPLTWISHMVDVELFGMEPQGHHLTNVALHAGTALVLFFLCQRLTGCPWRSALLALLFAVHPTHVESVAWAAERKDLLCGLFFILTLFFYADYARHGGARPYLLALLAFTLGALAKPMIVSLPLVLILLDHWPLARRGTQGRPHLDKIPFFLGSGILAVVTLIAQSRGGSLASLSQHPLPQRLANAALATLAYVGKVLLPVRLAVFYPYAPSPPWWQVAAATLCLVVITALALRNWQQRPYLAVGWLWFVVTLVPVSGVVQVGEQAMADRYLYLPSIGLLLILVWGGAELGLRYRLPRAMVGATSVAVIALLSLMAWRQTRHWQDQYTLFRHALAVTGDNHVACFQEGVALVGMDRLAEAAQAFSRSIASLPTAKAHNDLAYVQERMGMAAAALANYQQAVALDPGSVEGHYNLGLILLRQWDAAGAAREFAATLTLDPGHLKARANLERARRMQAVRRP
jgi:hypothetical protein